MKQHLNVKSNRDDFSSKCQCMNVREHTRCFEDLKCILCQNLQEHYKTDWNDRKKQTVTISVTEPVALTWKPAHSQQTPPPSHPVLLRCFLVRLHSQPCPKALLQREYEKQAGLGEDRGRHVRVSSHVVPASSAPILLLAFVHDPTLLS